MTRKTFLDKCFWYSITGFAIFQVLNRGVMQVFFRKTLHLLKMQKQMRMLSENLLIDKKTTPQEIFSNKNQALLLIYYPPIADS